MRALFLVLVFGLTVALFPSRGYAQVSGSHTVTIRIDPISVIAVSGDPMPLMIDKASDEDEASAIDESSFYNLTTNMPDVEIWAELDFAMPEGVDLWLTAESALGASTGKVQLDGSGRDERLITRIDRGLENGRSLRYELFAGAGIGEIPFQSRLITLSINDPATGARQQVTQTVSFGVTLPATAEETN